MAAERTWDFEDQARLFRELTLSRARTWTSSTRCSRRATAPGPALRAIGGIRRDLIRYHGTAGPGELLGRLADGPPLGPLLKRLSA